MNGHVLIIRHQIISLALNKFVNLTTLIENSDIIRYLAPNEMIIVWSSRKGSWGDVFYSTPTEPVWRISPRMHSNGWRAYMDWSSIHARPALTKKIVISTAIIAKPEYIQNTKSNNTFMQNYIYMEIQETSTVVRVHMEYPMQCFNRLTQRAESPPHRPTWWEPLSR